MIHLIHAGNRHLYAAQLAEMHRQRCEHFIGERGWALNAIDGGEYDEYDDAEAAYLVGFSAEGEVAVSVRFRPTEQTSLIADVFPHLISPTEQPVKGPAMYEATRYCAAKPFRGERGFTQRSKLHLAMLEAMVDRAAARLIGFMDVEFIPYFRRFSGLSLRPLGMPAPYDQGTTLAFELGVRPEDVAGARAALRIGHRQLFEAPTWLPAQADPIILAQATEILINAAPNDKREVVDAMRAQSARLRLVEDIPGVIADLARRAA
jgi:acyl-homoserine lactone synthase